MNNSSHPSAVLKAKAYDVIREAAAKAEKDGRLTKAQMNVITEHNWFKLLAPSTYGGLQMPLIEAAHVVEALAWADASAGWTVTSCANAGWLCGFAEPELAKKILSEEKVCIAGGTEPSGTAEKTENGYVINGKWNFTAGVADATAVMATCVVTHNGNAQKQGNDDKIMTFALLKNEISVVNSWSPLGLVAAVGQSFEVKNLEIPADRAFLVAKGSNMIDAPLYHFPIVQFAEAILASNISGIAIRFMDLCEAYLTEKTNRNGDPLINERLVRDVMNKHMAKMNDARTKLFYAIELAWMGAVNFQQVKEAILYKVSAAAYELAKRARECADATYPFCGMQAMDKTTEMNRVWRDLHAASQHTLLVYGGLPE